MSKEMHAVLETQLLCPPHLPHPVEWEGLPENHLHTTAINRVRETRGNSSQVWWLTPGVPSLKMLRQEDCKSKATPRTIQ